MNYLAWGGQVMNSCKVAFKTTPVNIKIPLKVVKYPCPEVAKHVPPPVLGVEEMYKRLMKGNIRVESAILAPAKINDSVSV